MKEKELKKYLKKQGEVVKFDNLHYLASNYELNNCDKCGEWLDTNAELIWIDAEDFEPLDTDKFNKIKYKKALKKCYSALCEKCYKKECCGG